MHSVPVRIFDKHYQVFGFPDEGWFKIFAATNEFTDFNLENLRPLVKPQSVCIDAGANYGALTLAMAALAPQGTVYSFEASETTHEALQATVLASGFENISTFPWILGRQGDSGIFIDDIAWRSSSHFQPSGPGPLRPCRSIDEMKLPVVDLIKIDVEGAELDVLDGAQDTLARCKPIVLMEFNSFAFIHYRNIPPRFALNRLSEIFPKICYFHKRVGEVIRLDDREAFLKKNMFNGFVDDLLCVWD